jgi:hypothetical protein
MVDGVPGVPDRVTTDGAAARGRGAAGIAVELERLIRDAEAGGLESLAYLVRIALYEARRLDGGRGENEGGEEPSA